MATLNPQGNKSSKKKRSFAESQRLAKQKSYEKQAKRKKIKLDELTVFTQQLAAMLEAGLPLVSAMEALEEQTENPVFQIIIRNVKDDISAGRSFSESCAQYPRAFPNLFVSMVEAGEASGGLAEILEKTSVYFADTVKLIKQVKGALVYPAVVISLAIILVNVLLVFVIPVFSEMFEGFDAELPKPTQLLIGLSSFLQSYIIYIIVGLIVAVWLIKRFITTPRGRRVKDVVITKIPVVGELMRKVNLSRFCRTYAILMRSGV
ncbi:MAG: type II secretion system F family protein, partial [Puniceicoccaceae bacterium]